MKKTLSMLPLLAMGLAFAAVPAQADGPFQFHSLTPCRIVDTRLNPGPAGAGTGSPALTHGQVRSFPIQGNCGVPAGAKAVAVNATVVSPAGGGHLTLFPSGSSVPLVSTLNFNAGEPALANGAIVPLSNNANDLSTQAAVVGGNGTVHLILDVTGYFQ